MSESADGATMSESADGVKLVQVWAVAQGDKGHIIVQPPPKVVAGSLFVPIRCPNSTKKDWLAVAIGTLTSDAYGRAVKAVTAAIVAERRAYSNGRKTRSGKESPTSGHGVHRSNRTGKGGWKGLGSRGHGVIDIKVAMGYSSETVSIKMLNDLRKPLWIQFADSTIRWLRSYCDTIPTELSSSAPAMQSPEFDPGRSAWVWVDLDGDHHQVIVPRFCIESGVPIGGERYQVLIEKKKDIAMAQYKSHIDIVQAQLVNTTPSTGASASSSTTPSTGASASSSTTPPRMPPSNSSQETELTCVPMDERWGEDDKL